MKLHKYQEHAVEFALEHKAVYLALDLGMGKTAIALTVIAQTGVKAVVFGPLRTIYTSWPEEIQKWAPQLSYYICHGPDKSLHGLDNCDIILINYEAIKWFSQQTGKWERRAVIFDESSKVKSHSTQRFKLLKRSSTLWLDYKICLSATPAPNSLQELWSQYYLLDKGKRLETTISKFRDKYCRSFSYPGMAFTDYKIIPEKAPEIHKLIAPITYRLEASDYLDMPDIRYNQIKLQMPVRITKQYKEFERDFFLQLDEKGIEAVNSAVLSSKLRQFVQGGIYDENKKWQIIHNIKIDALKELVETSAGQPILCAIQFKGELLTIRRALGSQIPCIAGGTSATEATKFIKQWNAGDIPLLLCHPGSLSHGVNLQTGGHVLLWYGLTWSLEQYLQLNGRLYRQGQKHGVIIHHLVMQETIDEAVVTALSVKDANQQTLLSYIKEYRGDKDAT